MQTAINRFQQDSIVTASPARLLTMLYDRLLLDGAEGLMALYVYAMKELVNANVQGDAAKAAEIRELFEPLAEAWKQAAVQMEQDDAKAKGHDTAQGQVKRTARGDLGVG